ncbi:uncharacterized protein P7C70_g6345, partial [Phenoliferia sp. Uapishka_3]
MDFGLEETCYQADAGGGGLGELPPRQPPNFVSAFSWTLNIRFRPPTSQTQNCVFVTDTWTLDYAFPTQPPPRTSSSIGPIRILSIDGDTFGGVSSLSIANRLSNQLGTLGNPAKLSESFDLIVGSGSGGVVALLLGRLGMDTMEAILKFKGMWPKLFGSGGLLRVEQGGSLSAEPLRAFMDGLCGQAHRQLLDVSRCKTLILASFSQLNTAIPVRLRSYPTLADGGLRPWTVAEAACATISHPAVFQPFITDGIQYEDAFGGIGKTTLAIAVMAHPRATEFGTLAFIACERLLTLKSFQRKLVLLRASEEPPLVADLEEAAKQVLATGKRFLILDNLLDSPSETPTDYRQFISTLADNTNLTLIITTRNHQLTRNLNLARRFHVLSLDALSPAASEELFRDEFTSEKHTFNLATPEPSLAYLLRYLGGIPLAIRVVAACARSAPNLEHVIKLWKTGAAAAWENDGQKDRENSLEYSLDFSFKHLSDDTINLLRLLCELPNPMYHRQLQIAVLNSNPIGLAIDAALRCSIAQVRLDRTLMEQIVILEPVRQYICRHWSSIDINSDIVRQLAFDYFSQNTHKKKGSSEMWLGLDNNLRAFVEITQGITDADFEQNRYNAVCRFIDAEDVELGWKGRFDLVTALRKRQPQTLLDTVVTGILEWRSRYFDCALAMALKLGTNSTPRQACEQAKQQGLIRTHLIISKLVALKQSGNAAFAKGVDLFDPEWLLYEASSEGQRKWFWHFGRLKMHTFVGNIEAVKVLLEGGDITGSEPATLYTKHDYSIQLENALIAGHVGVVELLAKAGADVNTKNRSGIPLLFEAVEQGHEMVKALQEAGASIDIRGPRGDSALHRAARSGDVQSVDVLVRAGASVNTKNTHSQTPLQCAVSYSSEASEETIKSKLEITRLILEVSCISLDWEDGAGNTPLHSAVTRKGGLEIVKLLLHHGASLDVFNHAGETPLHYTVKYNHISQLTDEETAGNLEVARLLLEEGASLETQDKDGNTPLNDAQRKGDTRMVKLFLQFGAYGEHKGRLENFPDKAERGELVFDQQKVIDEWLSILDTAEEFEITQRFLYTSVDDTKNNRGQTSLHLAAWEASKHRLITKGRLDTAELLVGAGASLESRDKDGATPLHLAAYYGQLEILRLLLGAGAAVNARLLNGATPLHYAALFGHREILRLLLGAQAAVDAKDSENGETPLHYAAFGGQTETARRLLEFGADINAKSDKGKTPLQIAVEEGKDDAVTVLTEALKAKASSAAEVEDEEFVLI